MGNTCNNSNDHFPPAVRRVIEHGTSAGVDIVPLTFPAGTRTASEAAAALDTDIAQIVKSLVFIVAGVPTLALVSGINQLNEAQLSVAAGGGKVVRADADTVRDATGFSIGGVAPFGSTQPLPVFIDRDLLTHDVVYAAAGRPDTVFAISPGDLVAASGAMPWDIAQT